MSEETVRVEEQIVVLGLAGENYGVDISLVQEIIRMQHVTPVPRAPMYVEGVTNIRGRVIPVVDLRKRFNLDANNQTNASRIVVVNVNGQTVGMIVDAVSEVLRITPDLVEPVSQVVTTVDSDYLRGIARVGEQLVILLSLEKALSFAASAA